MKRLYVFLSVVALSASVVAQSTNNVVFSFDHKAGAETMVLNQTVFSIWNGKKVMLTRAQYYLALPEIVQPNGETVILTDRYMLVDAGLPNAQHDLGSWDVAAASGLKLNIGVDAAHNHLDPTLYPADHPLAPKDPVMHWGWASGYRFMAIEGKVDNNNDGVPETDFQFHNLGDGLYQTVELSGGAVAENGALNIHLTMDYVELFDGMALTGNLIQHGDAVINAKMMNNAAGKGFINMPTATDAPTVWSDDAHLAIAPNPANDNATVSFALEGKQSLELRVINTLGQVVRAVGDLPATGQLTLELGQLPQGTYQCVVLEAAKLVARKILTVQH